MSYQLKQLGRSATSLKQMAGLLRLGRSVGGGYGGVVAFDDGAALKGAQDLIAAGNDLVALLESGEHFDVGGSRDPGGDRNEDDAEFSAGGAESVDALVQHGLGGNGGAGRWSGCRGAGQLSIVPGEDLFHGGIALNQRLNGDDESVGFLRDRDLCGGGETGTEVVELLRGELVEGDDNLEVLGLLGASGGLRGGDSGGAQQRLVADLGDMAFEGAAGERIDGDVGGLAQGHVDDVTVD